MSYPHIWEAEIAALAAAGASWSPTDDCASASQPDSGATRPERRILRLAWPHPAPGPADPNSLDLVVHFPASYPWFPPRVFLPDPPSDLVRHHSSVTGELCLLASDDGWRPTMTVAGLLSTQLPRLLTAGRDTAEDAYTLQLETGAEPAWVHLPLSLGGLLVEPESLPGPDVPGGWADLGVAGGGTLSPVHALLRLLDADQRVLWTSPCFTLRDRRRIRWVRLPATSARMPAAQLWRLAEDRLRAVLERDDRPIPASEALLVLMPSESADRRPVEEFLLLTQRSADGDDPIWGVSAASQVDGEAATPASDQLALFDPTPSAAARRHQMPRGVQVRRSFRIGRDDLTARLPGDLGAALAQASVTVVGVGALGGPIALELARAGVKRLRLIDGDTHDPATNSRQLLTLQDAGQAKALAIAVRCVDANPHVEPSCGLRLLGRDGGRELPELIGSDLVVDATANLTVTRYLASHLRQTGTPLLVVSATAGGWGGAIVTLPAAGGGCWECLQLHRADRADHAVPWPPAKPDGQIAPVGCSHPTYEGGFFDLGQVALQAARTAVTLLGASPRRPAGSHFGDLQVLSLYNRGRPHLPRWQARELREHPRCPLHRGIRSGTDDATIGASDAAP